MVLNMDYVVNDLEHIINNFSDDVKMSAKDKDKAYIWEGRVKRLKVGKFKQVESLKRSIIKLSNDKNIGNETQTIYNLVDTLDLTELRQIKKLLNKFIVLLKNNEFKERYEKNNECIEDIINERIKHFELRKNNLEVMLKEFIDGDEELYVSEIEEMRHPFYEPTKYSLARFECDKMNHAIDYFDDYVNVLKSMLENKNLLMLLNNKNEYILKKEQEFLCKVLNYLNLKKNVDKYY
jgi:hypothetical protein